MSLLLKGEEALARHARTLALALPRHVEVVLLDSADRLVSTMLFPVAPDPATLMAGLYAARTARMALLIVRQGQARAEPADRDLAVGLLEGARFLGIPIDALVVTPSGHEVILRSREPGGGERGAEA